VTVRLADDDAPAEQLQTRTQSRLPIEAARDAFVFKAARRPAVAYAYMQAIGMVNDRTVDFFRYRKNAHEFIGAT